MGNELEDALRAAAAAGKGKSAVNLKTQQSSATAAGGQSPARKLNKKRKAKNRRSRSDSVASASGISVADDPVQRLEAFKARMFEVGNDAATAKFNSNPAKSGDDVLKVQWKGKKPAVGGRGANSRPGDGDDDGDGDAVPQLTRARVIKSQPKEGVVVAIATMPTAMTTNKKKKNKNKKKNHKVVVEIKVPLAPPQPMAKPNQPQPQKKTTAGKIIVRADLYSKSENELPTPPAPVNGEVQKQTPTPTRLATATAKPVAKATFTTLTTTPMAKRKGPTALPKTNAMATVAPPNVKAMPVTTAVRAVTPKQAPVKKLTPTRTPPTKKPAPKAASAAVTSSTHLLSESNGITNDDNVWDLDSLVKTASQKKTIKTTTTTTTGRKASVSENEGDDDDDDDLDIDDQDEDANEFQGSAFKEHRLHLFSQLIDEAARDQWELVEVGRLVRIFAAQWSHKKKKTAKFLRRYCPELVSVDFLEGLAIQLEPQQLITIFTRGSGSQGVLLNKIASAIENKNLRVHDDAFLHFVANKTDSMATNQEVMEFLVPLMESMTTVKDVGVLLKAICQHWQLERTAALVQDILLTPVFDDLDGQQDEILVELPQLDGRIDFPSRMDAEDADENGNLKGLIAGDDSDLGESDADSHDEKEADLDEVLSEDADGDDSHAEDDVYEGETDSEEEREGHARLMGSSQAKRRRSRFVLDEAEEDDDDGNDEPMEGDDEGDDFITHDDGDGEEEEEEESDDSSDDSASEDDAAPTKPQRKRLRRG